MNTNAAELMRHLIALEKHGEAITYQARALQSLLRDVLREAPAEREATPPAAAPPALPDCKCPPNQRRVAPLPGKPQRTICKLCTRAHE